MSKVISERSFEIKMDQSYFVTKSQIVEANYKFEKARLKNPVEGFLKYQSFFKFLDEKENRNSEALKEDHINRYNYFFVRSEKKIKNLDKDLELIRIKLTNEFYAVRKFLPKDKKLLFIRFYNENVNLKNKVLFLENSYDDYRKLKIENKTLVGFLREKLLTKECDMIKIEICKPLKN